MFGLHWLNRTKYFALDAQKKLREIVSRYDRCTIKPTYIIHELKPGKDNQYGSMSVCVLHKDKFLTEMIDTLTNYKFTQIL